MGRRGLMRPVKRMPWKEGKTTERARVSRFLAREASGKTSRAPELIIKQ